MVPPTVGRERTMEGNLSTTLGDLGYRIASNIHHTLTRLTRIPVLDAASYETKILDAGCPAVIQASGTTTGATAALALAPSSQDWPEVELFRTLGNGALPSALANGARIDALTRLLEDNPANAPWYSLYVDDLELRREITALQDSFPTLLLTDSPHAGASSMATQAIVPTAQTPNPPAASTPMSPAARKTGPCKNPQIGGKTPKTRVLGGETHLVIATDASIVPGIPGAGIAYAASNGITYQGWMGNTCDITWAELNAIHAALTASAGHARVNILSDSKSAVEIAMGRQTPGQARLRRLAAAIAAEMAGRDVSVQWVRSHHGHPLNESADALARGARRMHAPAVVSTGRGTVGALRVEGARVLVGTQKAA